MSLKWEKWPITYPNVTKPNKVFDKSFYFREHLKNSKSKINNTQTHTHPPKKTVCEKYKKEKDYK